MSITWGYRPEDAAWACNSWRPDSCQGKCTAEPATKTKPVEINPLNPLVETTEQKTSIFSKWWFWLIAAILAIAVGYGGYLAYQRFKSGAMESADMDIINMPVSNTGEFPENGGMGEFPENGGMGEFPENGGMGEFPANERNYGNEFGNYGNRFADDYFYENIENFGGDGIATELPDTMSLQKK